MKRLLLSAAAGALVVMGVGFMSIVFNSFIGVLLLFWPLFVLPPLRSPTDESFISRPELALSLLCSFAAYSLLIYLALWWRARQARADFL